MGILRSRERAGLAVMWGFLLVLGPLALVLTLLNDPRHVPLALVVIIDGTVTAVMVTALKAFPRRRQGSD